SASQLLAVSELPNLVTPTKKPKLFRNQAKELTTRYALAKLELAMPLAATPEWMKQRLVHAGVRPVNIMVDVTNYVMCETGQPLHAFDAAKVSGAIVVRLARRGEKIRTLDGVERRLGAADLVIADAKKALGIAGVMGGANSEVGEQTQEILLEAATFDGPSIRKTALRQGLRTEASGRFEHGLPVQLVSIGLARALELLEEHAGAKVMSVEDELNIWPWLQHIGVRAKRLSRLAGMAISQQQILSCLRQLGFAAEPFDIVTEAKKHLGKPYVFGAKFKTHGNEAFDCSYLIDYIYSLIGLNIGHTALGQYEHGWPVDQKDLKPGDVVFYEGLVKSSATSHYYVLNHDKTHSKRTLGSPKKVGHNGLYIGRGKVIMAARYQRRNGRWQELKKPSVVEVPLTVFTKDAGYLGARRYVEDLEGYITVDAPYFRPDINNEVDVFEEVIKLVGLDKLPATLPSWDLPSISYDDRLNKFWLLRLSLYGLGLVEVTTYPFVSPGMLEVLGLSANKHLKLGNPRSVEQSYLRTNLLPSLLEAASSNARLQKDFGLFEQAKVFLPSQDENLPTEPLKLGVIWQRQDAYLAVKNSLDNVAALTCLRLEVAKTSAHSFLHPHLQADIAIDDQAVGLIGELHPRLIRRFKLQNRCGYLELDLDRILTTSWMPTYQPVSRRQPVSRDITVMVDQHISWQQIEQVLKGANLARFSYLGDYYGKALAKGQRALSLRLVIPVLKHTLTDKEIETKFKQIVQLLADNFGARLKD
ncbi:C40 family peptidase, partial [Candidatus Microgenomates bacterium]|nr:C40 family peptidase [Candidatus Microgenomates bacterium]